MVRKQTGKKDKKKKGSILEKEAVPGSAGSGKKKSEEVKRTSSDLNDSGSDYVADDPSLDSGGKTKSHKQKGNDKLLLNVVERVQENMRCTQCLVDTCRTA